MNLAVKISLLSSGLFLLLGMLIGVVKYRRMLTSPAHNAPFYIDTAHRAAFLYSFAMPVIARLLEHSRRLTKLSPRARPRAHPSWQRKDPRPSTRRRGNRHALFSQSDRPPE